LCHFWFNTFFLVDPKMQFILSNYTEKHPESNLGVLTSYLIPEYGLKHIYTMIKKDIDGLHKDKLHRLVPPSFTVSFIIHLIDRLLLFRFLFYLIIFQHHLQHSLNLIYQVH
jgi:hypothetical protein